MNIADPTAQLDKFVVHQGSPPALPGCCLLCNTSKQSIRYIDPRRDLEWHGTIYLCEECVIEMSHKIGMITAEEADDLKDDNRILCERLAFKEKQVERLEQQIDLFSQRRLSDRVTESTLHNDYGQGENSEPASGVQEPSSGVTGTEQVDAKPTDEPRSDDASDSGSDDDTFGLNL